MARYIFITGGVVSSLGKGLAAASLGALLQARGYSVRLRKLDPYLNVDPGTMSPYEHGEVFVTDDAAETDLDLGHYERFTGVPARSSDSISAGRIYRNVLDRERRGAFLGKTIQVIPHVTDEIKEFLALGADEVDFMLCEIGGTVGDIEGLPFFEAMRQFHLERPAGTVRFVHVGLLPFLEVSGELKTKPIQHSVKELRSIGIQPDVLLCRFPAGEVPEFPREKIALFCNVRPEAVIPAPDLGSIYQAPISYHQEGLDSQLLRAFGMVDAPAPDLSRWKEIVRAVQLPERKVNIGVIGKYTLLEDAYKSLGEALVHGGIANRAQVVTQWVDAESLGDDEEVSRNLAQFDGILVPGGFGSRGSTGKIAAVRYAREREVPFFGICLGMQMAVVEAARNLTDIADPRSQEFDLECSSDAPSSGIASHVVYHMEEWQQEGGVQRRDVDGDKGGTMRLGAHEAVLTPDSLVARIYESERISERHRHRYEVDVRYREALERAGLRFSGMSPDGRLPEVVEHEGHPWFVGVQFHPELKSRPFAPHPLFADFIRAAIDQSTLL